MASKPRKGTPWLPAPYENADIAAIQALAKGEARAEQQIRALTWIVEKAARTYDMTYQPESARDSDFAEGKRYVGNQIVKMTKINIAALRKTDERHSSSRDPDRDPSTEYANADEQRTAGRAGKPAARSKRGRAAAK